MDIELLSNSKVTISNFRLEDLKREIICQAKGLDGSGNLLYDYDHKTPDETINGIYEDMVLQGFFAQPPRTLKEKGEEGEVTYHIGKAPRDANSHSVASRLKKAWSAVVGKEH